MQPKTNIDSLIEVILKSYPHLTSYSPTDNSMIRFEATGSYGFDVGVSVGKIFGSTYAEQSDPHNISLVYLFHGDETWVINGNEKFQLNKENLLFVGRHHKATCLQHNSIWAFAVGIKSHRLEKDLNTLIGQFDTDWLSRSFSHFIKGDPETRDFIESIYLSTILSSNGGIDSRRADEIVRFVSRLLINHYKSHAFLLERKIDELSLDNLRDYMRSRISDDLSSTDLEDRLGVGIRSIQKQFKNRFGASPFQWLKEERLLYAHFLLKSGQALSVMDAAIMSGHHHLGRFSVDFRGRFGIKPSSLVTK
jgi:AraC-like DNA-binding protein